MGTYRQQEGNNLGARMSNAMKQAMSEGAKQVLIVSVQWNYRCQ